MEDPTNSAATIILVVKRLGIDFVRTSSYMIFAIFTSYPLLAHFESVFRCFRENPLMALTTGFNIS